MQQRSGDPTRSDPAFGWRMAGLRFFGRFWSNKNRRKTRGAFEDRTRTRIPETSFPPLSMFCFFFCIRNWVSTAPNMGQMGVKDMTDPSENPNHPKESQRNLRGPPGKRCAELAAANS